MYGYYVKSEKSINIDSAKNLEVTSDWAKVTQPLNSNF